MSESGTSSLRSDPRTSRRTWSEALSAALVSGAVASLTSTLALSLFGKKEIGDPAAPLNGPSQWLWGRRAAYRRGFSLRHTVLGYAIHHVAATFWAAFFEKAQPRLRPLPAAAVTTAMAFVVDYRLTPQRLRPGFEKRLSKPALLSVYAAFAAGLAATHLLARK